MTLTNQESNLQQATDKILGSIIDDWYENISGFYSTREQLETESELGKRQEELKRFHDERGHRIKFNKDDLDFTYGLLSRWQENSLLIEVSVNNKVERFDYQDFQRRLLAHYENLGEKLVPTPYELKNYRYCDIFLLKPNPTDAFQVETRAEGADIMRLSFNVNNQHLERCLNHPVSAKNLIENYCVSPFRTVYAAVYRKIST